MSWVAMFQDGPLAGREHERSFVGAWQRDLYFMPVDGFGDGWALVGLDDMPPDPHPSIVHYVRDEARTQLLPDIPAAEIEGWASYRLARDSVR